jgi:hypothetical protein
MFAQDRNKLDPLREEAVEVDAQLEWDISAVEQAARRYLESPSAPLRQDMLVELEELDSQIARGDSYASQPLNHGALGYESNPAIGATGDHSPAEELTDAVFRAQVEVVKAAKDDVRGSTGQTVDALHDAITALEAARAAAEQTASPRSPTPPNS